jgi:histidyl-tRNA synthetase
MKKQMQYANAKSIPFVAIAGETEIAEGKVMLKNMITGEQKLLAVDEVIAEILK